MSTTLYASDLPSTATAEMLAGKFERFGRVVSVRLDCAANGASRRGAFIEMQTATDARRAIEGLNLASFDGRLVSDYAALDGKSFDGWELTARTATPNRP